MSEDEERRSNRDKAGRRDAARGVQRTPPLIEGQSSEVVGEPGSTPGLSSSDPGAEIPKDTPSMAAFAAEDVLQPDASIAETADHADFIAGTAGSYGDVLHPADPTPPIADRVDDAPPVSGIRPASPETDGVRSVIPAILVVVVLILAAAIIYLFYDLSTLGPDLSPDVAALKTQVAAIDSRPPVDISPLSKRIDGTDATLSGLKGVIAALGKRVDTISAAPASTVSAPAQAAPDLAPRIAALDMQISDLKRDLAALRTSVANIPKPDFGPVNGKIGDVDQRLSSLQAAVNSLPRIDLGPLTTKVDALDTRFKPVEAEVDAAKSPQRVAERQAAPVAVTAQAIVDAIGSSHAFPKEFRALQALGADPAKLAPLQVVADSGAPTLGDLQADLARLRDRMVADGTPPATGSYVDRLMAGAGTLVHVRPLGSVVGDTPAAIVARIDADIGNDDLQAALDEWKKLPDPSRSASKALIERITLRLNAETAAKSIATDAIGAMAAQKG